MYGFENGLPRVFPKGVTICSQGRSAGKAYVVLSGRVAIERELDGRILRLSVLRRRALFGEILAPGDCPSALAAVALTPAVVTEISGDVVRQRVSTSPPVVRGMAGLLQQNLRYVERHFSQGTKRLHALAGALLECSCELHGLVLDDALDSRRLEDIARRTATLDGLIDQFAAGARLGAAFILAGGTTERHLLADVREPAAALAQACRNDPES